MSFDPVTAVAAGINSSIKILEVTYLLKAVGEQVTDLLRTAEHVNRNINEARRLRHKKASLVSVDEGAWMDSTIDDTVKALQEVASLIEPARVDTAVSGSIKPGTRALWVFRDSPKVRDKHSRLTICNQSLIGVINGLHAKDVVVVAPVPTTTAAEPPPYDEEMEKMLSWQRKRRRRQSTPNLQEQRSKSDSVVSSLDTVPPVPSLQRDLRTGDSGKDGFHLDGTNCAQTQACERARLNSEVSLLSVPQSSDPRRTASSSDIWEDSTARPASAASSSVQDATHDSAGLDGLQVNYDNVPPLRAPTFQTPTVSSAPLELPSTFWSPVSLGLDFHPSNENLPIRESRDPAPSFMPASERHSRHLPPSRSPASVTSDPINQAGTSAQPEGGGMRRHNLRTRGHQWLACYAARNGNWSAGD